MATAKSIPPLIVAIALSLGGCYGGLRTPDMQEPIHGTDNSFEEADENLIVNEIKCELHNAFLATRYDKRFYPNNPTAKDVDWLDGWGAKISFVLTADEKGSFNPGVTFTDPFHKSGTSFSVGGGLQSSAEATRKETVGLTYAFKPWLIPPGQPIPEIVPCTDPSGILIHSDLKIKEFVSNKVFLTRVPGTVPDQPVTAGGSPSADNSSSASASDTRAANSAPQVLSAFSDELTFIVIYGGNVTPGWKFVRLSVNPTSPMLSDVRTKTQYVSITLGPVAQPSTPQKAAQLNSEAISIDNANLIGHAVSTAIQGALPNVTLPVP